VEHRSQKGADVKEHFATLLLLTLSGCSGAPQPAGRAVKIHHVPEKVYTAVEGAVLDAAARPPGAHADTQNLTWLFHLVLTSQEDAPLAIERVEAGFARGDKTLWRESWSREYLERLEWIEGAFEMTTSYFLRNIEFQGNAMVSKERATTPDIPPRGSISWVRIPMGRPWFARIDRIDFELDLKDPQGRVGSVSHSVPVIQPQQKVKLRLPLKGTWVIHSGNDLGTGHRRTGLNGLTTYAWDIVKMGPNGMPYRTDGKTPQDYYTYGEDVLAAGDGVVVHVRNDIPDFGIGENPPRELLESDVDVFAGNLVVIEHGDHGGGEYSLTCHMKPGSVPVKVGDRVGAGQLLGKAGNSGHSQIPHIHFNLMDGPRWLEAKGVPALFSDFERIRTGRPPERIARGNPVSGWWVRPIE